MLHKLCVTSITIIIVIALKNVEKKTLLEKKAYCRTVDFFFKSLKYVLTLRNLDMTYSKLCAMSPLCTWKMVENFPTMSNAA